MTPKRHLAVFIVKEKNINPLKNIGYEEKISILFSDDAEYG